MIVAYHRPSTIAQALELLSKSTPAAYPLGGGTVLSRKKDENFAVVDLQNLRLNTIQPQANQLMIGATVCIQDLVENPSSPAWLKNACRRETSRNQRQMNSIAGFLMCANGRSPLAIALLAADIKAVILPVNETHPFQQILTERDSIRQPWLISQLVLDTDSDLKFEFVARSPVDLPVFGLAIAKWPSGRMRVAVGGFGLAPRLAYEGESAETVQNALETVLKDSSDEWASAEYRQSIAPAVLNRLLNG